MLRYRRRKCPEITLQETVKLLITEQEASFTENYCIGTLKLPFLTVVFVHMEVPIKGRKCENVWLFLNHLSYEQIKHCNSSERPYMHT